MPVQLSRQSPTQPSFNSEFFQQKPSPLPWCHDISYPRKMHETLDEFERHEDFPIFQKQYEAVLDEFSEIIKSYGLDDSNVEQLKTRLFDPQETYYGGRKDVIFGPGKRSLSKFISQLQNDLIPLDTRRDKARNLIENMDVCADGVATHISMIARDLELLLCGEEIYRHKNLLINQLITEFVCATPDLQLPGMELHYVNKISNALAEQFGLPVHEDSWRVDQEITGEVIFDCGEYILKKLTPVTLALHLAETCVADLKENMRSYFGDSQSGANEKSFDLDLFYENIKLTLEQQQGLYGQIEMSSMVGPVGQDADRHRLYTDSTLVAVDIINSLKQAGRVENYSPRLLYSATQENVAIKIEGMGDLVWASEDGTAVPLTARHLSSITPHQSVDGNHLIAAKAIENSSVASLIENLSSEWLEHSDIVQLLSKSGHEHAMTLIEAHWTFFERHYPLDLAKIIVSNGNAAQFTRYMESQPALFAPDDFVGILFGFWNLAANPHKPEMLEAVVNLAIRAISPTTTIPTDVLDGLSYLMQNSLQNSNESQTNIQAAAISHVGDILIAAREMGHIDSAQLASLLLLDDVIIFPGFRAAMAKGNQRQIKAFGDILLQAADKGLLDSQQITRLLEAPSTPFSALALALNYGRGAAVKAFGEIITSLYDKKRLNEEQVALLLSCRTNAGYSAAPSSLRHNRPDVRAIFSKMLLEIDSIRQRNADQEGNIKTASPLLECIMTVEELDERPLIDDRTEADLHRLLLTIRRLQTIPIEAVFDRPTPDILHALEMELQRIRVDLFTKDTYCTHDRHRANQAMFVQLRKELDILRGIPS